MFSQIISMVVAFLIAFFLTPYVISIFSAYKNFLLEIYIKK